MVSLKIVAVVLMLMGAVLSAPANVDSKKNVVLNNKEKLWKRLLSALHDVDKQSVKQKSDVKTRQFLPGIHGYPQTGLGTGYDPSAMGHGYDPSGMATGYDHSAMGHGYDPSAMGHDYDPSGMATGYDHSAMGHGYDPSAMGHGYDPSGMATGYDPSGMATGYDPSAMGHGYDPSAMGTGYDHSGMGSGYDPSGMGTGYDPSGMGHDTGFPVAPAAMYDHKNFMTREEVIDFFYDVVMKAMDEAVWKLYEEERCQGEIDIGSEYKFSESDSQDSLFQKMEISFRDLINEVNMCSGEEVHSQKDAEGMIQLAEMVYKDYNQYAGVEELEYYYEMGKQEAMSHSEKWSEDCRLFISALDCNMEHLHEEMMNFLKK